MESVEVGEAAARAPMQRACNDAWRGRNRAQSHSRALLRSVQAPQTPQRAGGVAFGMASPPPQQQEAKVECIHVYSAWANNDVKT